MAVKKYKVVIQFFRIEKTLDGGLVRIPDVTEEIVESDNVTAAFESVKKAFLKSPSFPFFDKEYGGGTAYEYKNEPNEKVS